MAKKIVISAALTGAVTPKELNPYIPLQPEEIAEDAYKCWKAGAAVVHLHMRAEDGKGCMDAERFAKTVSLIKAHKDCDVIINCTSSGVSLEHPATEEERYEHFTKIPEIEIGSYDAGTMNWGMGMVFDNNPKFLVDLANCYTKYNVKPEVEIFDMGMIQNIKWLIQKGFVKEDIWVQLVLGVLGGAPATVDDMLHLVKNLPPKAKWSAFGIGKDHMPIMYAALAAGADGIRVGLEDNVMYAKGVPATNVMLVERAARVIKEFGYEVATPAEAREILGLKQLG
jgi:uncharacterized protein (DUF849 family)